MSGAPVASVTVTAGSETHVARRKKRQGSKADDWLLFIGKKCWKYCSLCHNSVYCLPDYEISIQLGSKDPDANPDPIPQSKFNWRNLTSKIGFSKFQNDLSVTKIE